MFKHAHHISIKLKWVVWTRSHHVSNILSSSDCCLHLLHSALSPQTSSTKTSLGLLILPLPLGLAALALFVLGVVWWRKRMAGALHHLRDHHRTHAPTTGQHNALVVTDIEVGGCMSQQASVAFSSGRRGSNTTSTRRL